MVEWNIFNNYNKIIIYSDYTFGPCNYNYIGNSFSFLSINNSNNNEYRIDKKKLINADYSKNIRSDWICLIDLFFAEKGFSGPLSLSSIHATTNR